MRGGAGPSAEPGHWRCRHRPPVARGFGQPPLRSPKKVAPHPTNRSCTCQPILGATPADARSAGGTVQGLARPRPANGLRTATSAQPYGSDGPAVETRRMRRQLLSGRPSAGTGPRRPRVRAVPRAAQGRTTSSTAPSARAGAREARGPADTGGGRARRVRSTMRPASSQDDCWCQAVLSIGPAFNRPGTCCSPSELRVMSAMRAASRGARPDLIIIAEAVTHRGRFRGLPATMRHRAHNLEKNDQKQHRLERGPGAAAGPQASTVRPTAAATPSSAASANSKALREDRHLQ